MSAISLYIVVGHTGIASILGFFFTAVYVYHIIYCTFPGMVR